MKPYIAVPATIALVYRAWSRNSLTPLGIFTASLTAVVHALHPWSVCYALLGVFFLLGTFVTKIKHNIKATLTQSASGSTAGEGPRTHIQVLANSLTASVLILLHTWHIHRAGEYTDSELCFRPRSRDVLVVGIVANYAAVASDTFSSELGILSRTSPRLITAPWRIVPPGTNGGVTLAGLLAGLLGAFLIAATSALLTPFCGTWTLADKATYTAAMTLAGFAGTLLDSLLGAVLQASVVDVHSGKVVEGEGGARVLVHHSSPMQVKHTAELRSHVNHAEGRGAIAKSSGVDTADSIKASRRMQEAGASGTNVADGQHESRRVAVGADILDNNGVNLLMAAAVSVGAMGVACAVWGVPVSSVIVIPA